MDRKIVPEQQEKANTPETLDFPLEKATDAITPETLDFPLEKATDAITPETLDFPLKKTTDANTPETLDFPLKKTPEANIPETKLANPNAPFGDKTRNFKVSPGSSFPNIPGYQIMSVLGKGGMGVVYKALQIKANRLVALKMIKGYKSSDREDIKRFKIEAEALARLQHSNIVQVFDVGEFNGNPYFTLEYCTKGSLDRVLSNQPQSHEFSARTVLTLAKALEAAHKANVIHRDLKPANVLINEMGDLKITDFGLAKKLDQIGETHTGAIMGTPSYMAPEQAAGKNHLLGPATDIYALGVILYECLIGRTPFKSASVMDILQQIIHQEPVPPSKLISKCSKDLETIALKCLQKEHTKRYGTAGELADDLARYIQGLPILARPISPIEKTFKWAKRSPFQAVSLIAAIFLIIIGIAAFYLNAQNTLNQITVENQKLALDKKEISEQKRLEQIKSDFSKFLQSAENDSTTASLLPHGDRKTLELWSKVEKELSTAFKLLENEASLKNFYLRNQANTLLNTSRQKLDLEKSWFVGRDKITKFEKHYNQAIVFGFGFTGLDANQSIEKSNAEAVNGLNVFFNPTKKTMDLPTTVYSTAEIKVIAEKYLELNLVIAENSIQEKKGEKDADSNSLNQALAFIKKAETLFLLHHPGLEFLPKSTLLRKSKLLAKLGRKLESNELEIQANSRLDFQPSDRLYFARENYRNQNFQIAQEHLVNLLDLQPGHYAGKYLLAMCRINDGLKQELPESKTKFLEAAKIGLNECLEILPEFIWPRLNRGFVFMQLRQYFEAGEDFDSILFNPPDPFAAYIALVNKGVLAMQKGEWDSAIVNFQKAIQLKPDQLAAHINLSLVLKQKTEVPPWQHLLLLLQPWNGVFSASLLDSEQLNNRKNSIVILDRAIMIFPNEPRLFHERGKTQLLIHDYKSAASDFQKAAKLGMEQRILSTLVDDLVELGRLQARAKEFASAEKSYLAALAFKPNDSLILRSLAQAQLALKKHIEASENLELCLVSLNIPYGKKPTIGQVKTLTEALKFQGMIQEEKAQLNRAKGLLELMEKDFRSSIDFYTQGLNFSRDIEILELRGYTYLTVNAFELAVGDFEEALKLNPKSTNALIGLGNAKVRVGKIQEGLKEVEDALYSGSPTGRQYFNAARAFAFAAQKTSKVNNQFKTQLLANQMDFKVKLFLDRFLSMIPSNEKTETIRLLDMDPLFDRYILTKPY